MYLYLFVLILGLFVILLYVLAELSSVLFTGIFTKAPYIPNENKHIIKALELVNASSEDILCDLGSGDGRVLELAISKFNVKKAIGYEIDPFQVFKTNLRIKLKHLSDKAHVERKDILSVDIHKITILYLYLYPRVLQRLHEAGVFNQLSKGTRIVSCRFAIPNMQFDKKGTIDKKYDVFIYTIK